MSLIGQNLENLHLVKPFCGFIYLHQKYIMINDRLDGENMTKTEQHNPNQSPAGKSSGNSGNMAPDSHEDVDTVLGVVERTNFLNIFGFENPDLFFKKTGASVDDNVFGAVQNLMCLTQSKYAADFDVDAPISNITHYFSSNTQRCIASYVEYDFQTEDRTERRCSFLIGQGKQIVVEGKNHEIFTPHFMLQGFILRDDDLQSEFVLARELIARCKFDPQNPKAPNNMAFLKGSGSLTMGLAYADEVLKSLMSLRHMDVIHHQSWLTATKEELTSRFNVMANRTKEELINELRADLSAWYQENCQSGNDYRFFVQQPDDPRLTPIH